MATELKLPEVGDNIEQGTVVSVLVKPGDTIEAGQAIIEIETDKAVVEVPAEAGGTVAEIKVKVGDSVPVGGVILTLEGEAAAPAQGVPAASPSQGGGDEAMSVESAPVAVPAAVQQPTPDQSRPAPAAPAPGASSSAGQDIVLPDVGDNIEQGTVVTVLVREGDEISEGQPIVELETDKAVVEVPSSAAGKVASVAVKVGDSVKIGGVLLTLAGGAGTSGAAAQSAPAQAEQTPAAASSDNLTEQPNLPPAAQNGGERPRRRTPTRRAPRTPRPSTGATWCTRLPACGGWPANSASTSSRSRALAPPDASAPRTCSRRPKAGAGEALRLKRPKLNLPRPSQRPRFPLRKPPFLRPPPPSCPTSKSGARCAARTCPASARPPCAA